MKKYFFTSSRLGFRNWNAEDLPTLHQINSDAEVMQFFPTTYTLEQTKQFMQKMQHQFLAHNFCYFAVDRLDSEHLIGFIGLSRQTFEADFTPCVDIGWRLARKEWGKGYATEGAKRCLEYAFYDLDLQQVYAICPRINRASESVMLKIGMKKHHVFKHPLLIHHKRLQECLAYRIQKPSVSN